MANEVRPVMVNVVSFSRVGEEEETPMRLRCSGQMRPTSGGCMLRYREVQTEESTGETLVQDVVLNIQPDRVSMTRMGDYGTTLVFVRERRFEGAYHTPFGDLALALYTTQLDVRLNADGGSVHLEYQLDMQGNYAAVQVIDVTFAAEGAC
ncbi:MAG: DUF1934 domain-containing protein [Clostridia bacterium]|nr:DUF1934 domain-containing protein [Clostridia bacterium]